MLDEIRAPVPEAQGVLRQPADIDRIAVVRLSALGDVTLTLPVVETLKQALPQTKITWITGSIAYRLLEGYPGVEFMVFDKAKGLSAYLELSREFHLSADFGAAQDRF
jgi:ADP-heptose:LPS heptosyltransferase